MIVMLLMQHLLKQVLSSCSCTPSCRPSRCREVCSQGISTMNLGKTRRCPQVPKRIYSLEELRLNKIEAERFLSPADETLNTVRTVLQVILRHLIREKCCSAILLVRAQQHPGVNN